MSIFTGFLRRLNSLLINAEALRYKAALQVLALGIAFWCVHVFCRIFLIFRNNAYGVPYVNKPDWYIFHAVAIDFVWIFELMLPFVLLVLLLPRRRLIFLWVFGLVNALLLPVTYLDHEVQRFMGSHLTLALIDTYKDASSLSMFDEYVSNDLSVPNVQFVIMPLLIPVALLLYWLIRKAFLAVKNSYVCARAVSVSAVALFLFSLLFLYVIWPGSHRMNKLAPVLKVFSKEISTALKSDNLDAEAFWQYASSARNFWNGLEGAGASDWAYPSKDCPLCRVPVAAPDSQLLARRLAKPNFIVVFLESGRGMDVGFLNPDDERESPTPVLDSLARAGHAWTRFFASGVPTVRGVLSTHLGAPLHRTRSVATDFTMLEARSFASVLRDSGYVAHFFSAADPAWDNLSVWFHKWYERTHYDRAYEDDSTFFDVTSQFIRDSLAKDGRPFLASMITRSNHYPFTLVPGMPSSEKQRSQQNRMRWTMHWVDEQLGRFLASIKDEPWFGNTYIVVLADHGFPQGERGAYGISEAGAMSSATWIPLVINGPGLGTPKLHAEVSGQQDVAPTILELAGLRVPNAFLGHDLLREAPKDFALGVYARASLIAVDGFRMLLGNSDAGSAHGEELYAAGDLYEKNPLQNDSVSSALKALADTLLTVNDFALSKNRMNLHEGYSISVSRYFVTVPDLNSCEGSSIASSGFPSCEASCLDL